MTERLTIEFDGHQYFLVIDEDNERCLARLDTRMDALAWLEMYKMLSEENEQLKEEKEFWKSGACSLSSLNSILSNELSIAQEQGYEPSKPYKEYITSIKTEYDKFWENKIKTHNNRLNGVR